MGAVAKWVQVLGSDPEAETVWHISYVHGHLLFCKAILAFICDRTVK